MRLGTPIAIHNMELIRRGDTMGCFYVESPPRGSAQEVVAGCPRQTSPGRRFEYLSCPLDHPAAANVFADEFVRRAHGQRYTSLILSSRGPAETLGSWCTGDVMKAVALGGFSVEDGDHSERSSVRNTSHDTPRLPAQFSGGTVLGTAVIDHIWR